MPAVKTVYSRELALLSDQAALLLIDMQNYCCHPDGGLYRSCPPEEVTARYGWFRRQLESVVIPNLQRLLSACRQAGVEVMHTTIESLTADGREQSLDYKISEIFVPKGAWDGQPIEALAPICDEIRLPKTASSVFNATNLDYLLRNLGVTQLVIGGVVTDQCVESAVRDACDRGYLVTLVDDGCTSFTPERHRNSLAALAGYCRQRPTEVLLDEIRGQRARVVSR
ncbi:MAG TPA: isochorismatase family cysteine hydrolase [Gammaproteobacteria bacterium]|nr:isochorismatase family cysteine hydrolase [Gammaproteobacteria bacterium]